VTFRGVLLTANVFLLGEAGLFLGSQRPAGSAGQLLAFACVLAQVLNIAALVRSGRARRAVSRSTPITDSARN
jgi:hypothetical protein